MTRLQKIAHRRMQHKTLFQAHLALTRAEFYVLRGLFLLG